LKRNYSAVIATPLRLLRKKTLAMTCGAGERRLRRSNLSRPGRTWQSVQEIASQKTLAMTRAEQLP